MVNVLNYRLKTLFAGLMYRKLRIRELNALAVEGGVDGHKSTPIFSDCTIFSPYCR